MFILHFLTFECVALLYLLLEFFTQLGWPGLLDTSRLFQSHSSRTSIFITITEEAHCCPKSHLRLSLPQVQDVHLALCRGTVFWSISMLTVMDSNCSLGWILIFRVSKWKGKAFGQSASRQALPRTQMPSPPEACLCSVKTVNETVTGFWSTCCQELYLPWTSPFILRLHTAHTIVLIHQKSTINQTALKLVSYKFVSILDWKALAMD